jgi:hypothetical protein
LEGLEVSNRRTSKVRIPTLFPLPTQTLTSEAGLLTSALPSLSSLLPDRGDVDASQQF